MIDTLLTPLYYGVTALLLGWRWVFSHIGFSPDSGATWTLSIVGLVVVIRIILIPLFVKQINASRKMVAIQPKMKALQEKHKGDRERLSQETMKLYKEEKANPFASCLPLLLQSPVFFALFRTLDGAAKIKNGHLTAHGLMSLADATSLNHAKLFGAGLSDTFTHAPTAGVKVITVILIIAMSATTFITQRQLTRKNMPASAMTGPMAQQQKLLLYGYPLFFAITGINFPIGVLLYWLTTNLWTTGQQYYVIKRNPTPGSPAWEEFQAKKAAQGEFDRVSGTGPAVAVEAAAPPVVRQQPRKTTRSQRGGILNPLTATSGVASPPMPRTGPARSGTPRPPAKATAPRTATAANGAAHPAPPAARGTSTGAPRTAAARPGAAKPAVGRAGTAKPAATSPTSAVSKPGVSKPGVSKPGVSKPGVSKPGAPQAGPPRRPAPRRAADGGATAVRRPSDDGPAGPRAPR